MQARGINAIAYYIANFGNLFCRSISINNVKPLVLKLTDEGLEFSRVTHGSVKFVLLSTLSFRNGGVGAAGFRSGWTSFPSFRSEGRTLQIARYH